MTVSSILLTENLCQTYRFMTLSMYLSVYPSTLSVSAGVPDRKMTSSALSFDHSGGQTWILFEQHILV